MIIFLSTEYAQPLEFDTVFIKEPLKQIVTKSNAYTFVHISVGKFTEHTFIAVLFVGTLFIQQFNNSFEEIGSLLDINLKNDILFDPLMEY